MVMSGVCAIFWLVTFDDVVVLFDDQPIFSLSGLFFTITPSLSAIKGTFYFSSKLIIFPVRFSWLSIGPT